MLFGTSDEEYWIGCETCDTWFHGDCISITPDNEPDKFYCSACVYVSVFFLSYHE